MTIKAVYLLLILLTWTIAQEEQASFQELLFQHRTAYLDLADLDQDGEMDTLELRREPTHGDTMETYFRISLASGKTHKQVFMRDCEGDVFDLRSIDKVGQVYHLKIGTDFTPRYADGSYSAYTILRYQHHQLEIIGYGEESKYLCNTLAASYEESPRVGSNDNMDWNLSTGKWKRSTEGVECAKKRSKKYCQSHLPCAKDLEEYECGEIHMACDDSPIPASLVQMGRSKMRALPLNLENWNLVQSGPR